MTAFEDAATFATDSSLFLILTAAFVDAAVAVAAEDPETPNHEQRLKLANMVLTNPMAQIGSFAWAVSTNAAIVTKWVTNNDHAGAQEDLPGVVESIWDALAGSGLAGGAVSPSAPVVR